MKKIATDSYYKINDPKGSDNPDNISWDMLRSHYFERFEKALRERDKETAMFILDDMKRELSQISKTWP